MFRACKFLMRPTVSKTIALGEMLRDHCSLYDGALQECRDAYQHPSEASIRCRMQSAQLMDIRTSGRSIRSAGGVGRCPRRRPRNEITDTVEQVSKRSGELADIFATVSAGWTGVEAAAFTSAQIGINEDHDEIRRLLNAVGRTKNLSTANDDEVRAAFNAVKELGSSGNSSGLNDI